MAGETGENPGFVNRLFDSIDRKLGLEKSSEVKTIYQYPKQGEPRLWVDLLTKETNFKAWRYSVNDSVEPEYLRTIPEATTRTVIHFFPPEAEEAYKRQTEEESWLDDPEFRRKNVSIARNNLVAFVDFLKAVREHQFGETEFIVGETNYIMANFAMRLGFKRCWEEGYNPPDLTRPVVNEDLEYKFGISVAALVELYDLDNQEPTESTVLEMVRKNNARIKQENKTLD